MGSGAPLYMKTGRQWGRVGLRNMAELEKEGEMEEKIGWNLLYPFPCWILWYALHCIMICKYDKMWVVLSKEIWSNALFSDSWKCLSNGRALFICFLRNSPSAISSAPSSLLSAASHSFFFFFLLNQSPSPTFLSYVFHSSPRMYGREKL